MRKSIFVLTAIALAASSVALAGNKPGDVTFTVSDAYYHFAPKRSFDNINLPNAALSYNINKNWAFEFGGGIVNTNINPSRVATSKGVHGSLYTLDALYRFSPYKAFEPYVSFGVGELTVSPNALESEHQGNINGGLGTQIFFDDAFAFRVEARDLYSVSGGANDYMLNFGMSFLFDGCMKCHQQQPIVSYKGESYKGDR